MKEKKQAEVIPVDDRLIIKKVTSPDDDETNKICRGVVVQTGPGGLAMNGERIRLQARINDGVIYLAEDALSITIESGSFDIVRMHDIICVLKV